MKIDEGREGNVTWMCDLVCGEYAWSVNDNVRDAHVSGTTTDEELAVALMRLAVEALYLPRAASAG